MELCEICGEGNTTIKIQMFKTGDGVVKPPLYYKECDACGSEYVDMFLSKLNSVLYKSYIEFMENQCQ
jgi:hypothetical protein